MKWKILESEYLHRRPWLTVRRDKVQLPNGTVNPEFYVLEYPDWVNVLAIDEDGKFVLIKQYRHGIQQERFELTAGVVDPGEEPLQAAKRELLEETGYEGGQWQLLCTICGNPSTTNNYTHCYLATGVHNTGHQHLEATEVISVHLLSREEVLRLMIDTEIVQALMLVPMWRYFALDLVK